MLDKKQNFIYSVKIAESILGIKNSIEVVFKENKNFLEFEITAMFVKECLYIVVNKDFLQSASLIEIMITGFHEVRHAYQYMQVSLGKDYVFKHPENQNTLIEWKKDFDNPKQPGRISKEEYLNRPTEIDAIAFSYYLADKLLNVKQVIPDEIKEKVFERVEELRYIELY